MMSLRSHLFAVLAVSVLACGGDREVPAPTVAPMPDAKPRVALPLPVVEPGPHAGVTPAPSPTPPSVVALAPKPGQVDHVELARDAIAKGQRSAAIRHALKAVKLAPSSSQAYNTLGRAELLRHNYDHAIEAFRQAVDLNATNAYAWNNLGYTYVILERWQDAVDALARATALPDATGYMWNNLGTAYEHLDELDDARVAYEKGGALGSREAKASRKRLEGVDTIVVMKSWPKHPDDPEPAAGDMVYEAREEMPDVVDEVVEDVVEDVEDVVAPVVTPGVPAVETNDEN